LDLGAWNSTPLSRVAFVTRTAVVIGKLADALSFEQVAHTIAANESDIAWLATGLRQWVWPQEGIPPSLRSELELGFFASIAEGRWSRKRLVKVLGKTLPDAIGKVSELTSDFAVSSYLTDRQFGAGFDFLQLAQLSGLLHEIRRRCEAVSLSSDLISSPGKAKAGRNKTLAPEQVDEKVACASAVDVAWRLARGAPPGAYVREAGDAAEILFALGMAPPGRFDLVKPRINWGDAVRAWPTYFAKAREPSPMLLKWNGMLEQKLEFFRAHHASVAHSSDQEIPPG
jgi:hypothetical protein